jgi:hypothetical protein
MNLTNQPHPFRTIRPDVPERTVDRLSSRSGPELPREFAKSPAARAVGSFSNAWSGRSTSTAPFSLTGGAGNPSDAS